MMKIAVAIATTGRAGVVREALLRLRGQTRAPDLWVLAGANPEDVDGMPDAIPLEIGLTGEKGLCLQRNLALKMVGERADVLIFFDDDFVAAPGFLAGVERLFSKHLDVMAATGLVVADGINSQGFSFEQADALVAAYGDGDGAAYRVQDTEGAYGCNMVIRLAAAKGLAFDVKLPLYGWQEDIDFTSQLSRVGRVVHTTAFAGVHLGVKSGRTSGKRLGYSQIANPAYLARKGTLRPRTALKLAMKNLVANLLRSVRPEAYIDRRGRLAGNLIALGDLLLGRADPTRILKL